MKKYNKIAAITVTALAVLGTIGAAAGVGIPESADQPAIVKAEAALASTLSQDVVSTSSSEIVEIPTKKSESSAEMSSEEAAESSTAGEEATSESISTPVSPVNQPQASGETISTVERSVKWSRIDVKGAAESNTVVGKKGDYFINNIRVFSGSKYQMLVALDNLSGSEVTAVLNIEHPGSLIMDVDIYGADGMVIGAARQDNNNWYLNLRANNGERTQDYDMVITIEVPVTGPFGKNNITYSLSLVE